MSVMTTTEKAGYDALVSGAAQAVKKDGSVAFTAAQSGVAAGAAANLAIRTDLDQAYVAVAAATTAALPTYSTSGGPGAGFTLTALANGAFPTLDGYATVTASSTEAPSSRFLLHHGAATSDNGVYCLTQQGSAGTPWIAVRYTGLDTAAKIAGSKLRIGSGIQKAGAEYAYRGITALTMGTSAVFWWRTDKGASSNELQVVLDTDFQHSALAATANVVVADCLSQFNTGAGAVCQILASSGTASRSGVVSCSSGTTTTGRGALINSLQASPVVLGTNVGFYIEFKGGVPTTSDGTNTFGCVFGLTDSASALPGAASNTVAITFQPAVSSTDWQITTAATSAVTNTGSGRTIVAGTDDHIILFRNPGDSNMYAFVNGTQLSAITTNIPTTGPMGLVMYILKSAGTTARTFEIDIAKCHVYYPQGRVA